MTFSKNKRSFLKKSALALSSAVLAPFAFFGKLSKLHASDKRSRVIIAKSDKLIKNPVWDEALADELLGKAMLELSGEKDQAAAWSKYFSPGDRIGLKLNCITKGTMSVQPAFAAAIVNGLKSAGVKENDIILWERADKDLREAGYKINTSEQGVRCFGTKNVVAGYSEKVTTQGKVNSQYSSIIDMVDKLICVPVLKHHRGAGVTLSIKNHMGSINNPRDYHVNHGSPYYADIVAAPLIKDKSVLYICDAGLAQYDGGPRYQPASCWNYGGLMISDDMVALDRVGFDIINAKRKDLAMAPVESQHIFDAAERGLGQSDIEKIDVKNV